MGGRKNFRSRFGLLPLLGRRLLNVRRVQNVGLSEYRKPHIVFSSYLPKALLGKPLSRDVLAQVHSMRTDNLPNR